MASRAEATSAVRAALQAFQDGYTHREIATLDGFMQLFSLEPMLEVIGTGAVSAATGEWCIDRPAVRELIESDWRWWGDLALDIADARIHVQDTVAWLATTGTVTQTIPVAQSYASITAQLTQVSEQPTDHDAERGLLELIRRAATTLANIRDGERFVWPIRFTAVLVQQEAAWLFHQIHFSFPTTHSPDVRVT